MVTTFASCLDDGKFTGFFDSTLRLLNALAQNVLFCRYDGAWNITWRRGRRNSTAPALAWCRDARIIIGWDTLGIT